MLIINFWSLAIIHSISFISWPFDLVHTILYFLATFVEVTAFTQITNPTGWFIAMFAFFVVSGLLYLWDALNATTPSIRRDPRWRWQVGLLLVLSAVVIAWNLRLRA